ncbi:hypothetical protein H6F67_19540 [Microcoleus sp. FACHB-1515]|uniref:hypothetical protein n=1 Tax=Cyanophyceae TaxID=3028117 RepID=UPI001682131D|nr:hypothetical protein [Microcoleus sp. FACHB-1515]MBD2092045.1 hypothetical protein [Microcoleus sp. FACHB-1515]
MMIPPASAQRTWVMQMAAVLLPIAIASVGIKQSAQASQTNSNYATLPDGVYLYGDTAAPNQISHSYVVFEHQDGQVIGAFYSPRSEFSCFAGEMQGTRLDVEAAVNGEPHSVEADTSLVGLHPIQSVGAIDRQILSTCAQSEIARSQG